MYIRILYHFFFGSPSPTAIVNFLRNICATTTICHPDDILSIYTLYLLDENRLCLVESWSFLLPGLTVNSESGWVACSGQAATSTTPPLIWKFIWFDWKAESMALVRDPSYEYFQGHWRNLPRSGDMSLSFGPQFDPVSQLLRQNSKIASVTPKSVWDLRYFLSIL